MLLRSIGATLIVVGTAVGAGMLAIPLVTATVGFGLACLLLVFCWAVMLATALLILEVNLKFERSASFATMAKGTIGKVGYALTWFSICFLLYALCAAYITGGSALFHLLIHSLHINLAGWVSAVVFTAFFGFFVFFGTRSVDYINRVLIFIKFGAFLILCLCLLPHVRYGHLSHLQFHLSFWMAIPVLMTSYGFHPVIPSLRVYLKDDLKRLRIVIITGATIPLFIYLLWEVCTLGVLPVSGPNSLVHILNSGGSVAELVSDLQAMVNTTVVKVFSNMFTDIAVTTSFLGVSLGLNDFLADGLKINRSKLNHRVGIWCLSFLIPLAFALFYPKGFVLALGYASIFVAVLLIVIPAWMAYEARGKKLSLKLILLTLIGFGVIALSVYQSS